jgi:hypothetical protein
VSFENLFLVITRYFKKYDLVLELCVYCVGGRIVFICFYVGTFRLLVWFDA